MKKAITKNHIKIAILKTMAPCNTLALRTGPLTNIFFQWCLLFFFVWPSFIVSVISILKLYFVMVYYDFYTNLFGELNLINANYASVIHFVK